jgi:Rrf2 family protein
MIHSTSGEYAIRAMVALATHEPGRRVLARDLAKSEHIPAPFLGKILQTLARAGLVTSTKGPGGGFSLGRAAADITLFDIYAAIDGERHLSACAVGLARCSDEAPCPLHDRWKPIREAIRRYLTTTSLADMTRATQRKRALAGDTPAS